MENKTKRKKIFLYCVIILVCIVLLGIVLSLKEITKSNNHASNATTVNKVHTVSMHPTFSPTVMPSVTPTLSVTPTPALTGYCLNVPVLFYHHVQPLADAVAHNNKSLTVTNDFFDTQMQYVSSHGYTTITAKQLIDALKNHTSLPPKSIVITLDDGYKDNYTYAYPILQKYHLIANIMLASGLMEGADYLTWGQIAEMQKSGLIYYTNHTWSHYAMNKGTTEKMQYEIQTAKQQIEAHTGQPVDVFTYPYGSSSSTAISLLKQDGFIGAFSTMPGKTQCDSFIMTLHRTRIGNASLSQYGI